MRNEFSREIIRHAEDRTFVFMTGDLGFMALEGVRTALGERFINAGVAEQNMVSAAAGMAKVGLRPWVYSIAPFVYARPFEQIRNGPCLHNLPVIAVGNGGGYAYGVMGATHHAIDDYGCLSTLPHMTIYVPAFNEDLEAMIDKLFVSEGPAYLRLGRDESPMDFKPTDYSPLRKIYSGSKKKIVLFCGPLVGEYLKLIQHIEPANRPSIWLLSEFSSDQDTLTSEFLMEAAACERLVVAEEHVLAGSIGSRVAQELLKNRIHPKSYEHLCAKRYPSGQYGSQQFHRQESGIDAESIQRYLNG